MSFKEIVTFTFIISLFEETFLSEESLINGKVRKAPALIQETEIPGVLEVFVKGIKATVFINNIDQGTIQGISELRLVQGGLKFGENTVEIVCEDTAGSAKKSIELSIKVKRKDDFLDVFRYEEKKNIQKNIRRILKCPRE